MYSLSRHAHTSSLWACRYAEEGRDTYGLSTGEPVCRSAAGKRPRCQLDDGWGTVAVNGPLVGRSATVEQVSDLFGSRVVRVSWTLILTECVNLRCCSDFLTEFLRRRSIIVD